MTIILILAWLAPIAVTLIASQASLGESKKNSNPLVRKGSIHGQVLLSPTCPVERNPPDPKCAPRPFVTRVAVWNASTGSQKGSIATSSSGRFTLSLPPGNYVLQAASGSVFPRCSDLPVKVRAGATKNVVINCDTGMR